MASSHGGLRWRTSLLIVGRPTLPPIPNLGVLLFHGRDVQGIRVDDLFVIGRWLKDSNLRWWRFCQQADLWEAPCGPAFLPAYVHPDMICAQVMRGSED